MTPSSSSISALTASLLTLGSLSVHAAVLLTVDLNTPNEITITATTGNSAISASGSDITGIYFENFYDGSSNALEETYISGSITNAENPSDGSPNLFRSGADPGLNLFSWSSDTDVSFTAGSLAFIGSGTWALTAGAYSDMVNGNKSGNLYFPADTLDDITGLEVIGTYVVIPEPGSTILLGLSLLGLSMRRSRRQRP